MLVIVSYAIVVSYANAFANPTGTHVEITVITTRSVALHVSTVRRASYAPSEDGSDDAWVSYRETLNPRVNTPQSREQADDTATEHANITQIIIHFDGNTEHQRRYRQIIQLASEDVETDRVTRLMGTGPRLQ